MRVDLRCDYEEPHGKLLNGILLGDSSGLPRALRDDFRNTGMSYIIAISGQSIDVLFGGHLKYYCEN